MVAKAELKGPLQASIDSSSCIVYNIKEAIEKRHNLRVSELADGSENLVEQRSRQAARARVDVDASRGEQRGLCSFQLLATLVKGRVCTRGVTTHHCSPSDLKL